MGPFRRIVILVLDSVGVGAMPDADEFGDEGSDTLGHVAQSYPLRISHLQRLGIGNIRPLEGVAPVHPAAGSYGKMALSSRGKDTTAGHWEMMGLVLDRPFPTYPHGFPRQLIREFEAAIGRTVLGNVAASGTVIIEQLGERHLQTGSPIVYTSADSVFQIAAHQEVIPVSELYRICESARRILTGEHQVGRVIARPFVGEPGHFRRTEGRKDYAIPPHISTVLDHLHSHHFPVVAVGKIASIYCYCGVDQELKTKNNRETAQTTLAAMEATSEGLIFSNFVDFDMLYGHRNDVSGYARALEEFDQDLDQIEGRLASNDLLMLVSDHGCDPTTASTDHSREYALLLTFSKSGRSDQDLGTRASLADLGATVAENFGVQSPAGTSFLGQLAGAGILR